MANEGEMGQCRNLQHRNEMMLQPAFVQRRVHPRFLFSADAEITLLDGTSVPTQLDELSARGCYVAALKPLPIGTEFRLRIWQGMRACETEGKVLYLHSGNTLGIFGMGVLFGDMSPDQRLVIDAWLCDLGGNA